jgi:hypothetical protein
MQLDEWRGVVSYINNEIQDIVRGQQIHSRILKQLDTRNLVPLEEDFIDADLTDSEVGAASHFDIDGVQITTRKLHRRGIHASDVAGADLLYEIEGQKFALIQYKTPNAAGRVLLDAHQLDTLIDHCPDPVCDAGVFQPRCGSWYAVRARTFGHYMRACEARLVFGSSASRYASAFALGLSKGTFDSLFARCNIGAPLSPIGMGAIVASSVDADRVLFRVSQRGRF